MQRRDFLVRTGLALGTATVAAAPRQHAARAQAPPTGQPGEWDWVRDQFDLTDDIHMALFFLAAHPRSVRDAIEKHRRGFDADPHGSGSTRRSAGNASPTGFTP